MYIFVVLYNIMANCLAWGEFLVEKGLFKDTKFFIIDMDGTFYLGNKLIPGATDFIERLTATGRDYCFFTNNSSHSAESCREKLAEMGFDTTKDKIIVSSHVAAHYLKNNYEGKKVYLLGNAILYDYFISQGIRLTQDNPDIVVLGFDTELTYERINKAANFLAGGAVYIATHPDLNCPVNGGFMPDTGSMIEMFAASTGRRPKVVGKPMTETVDYITSLLGCGRNELAFVGDRLATDIAVASNHGIPSALVFSGVTSPGEYGSFSIRATAAVNNIGELSYYL